jgi:hypothetical protein
LLSWLRSVPGAGRLSAISRLLQARRPSSRLEAASPRGYLLLIAVGVAMALGVGAGLLIAGLAHSRSLVSSNPTASQVSDGQLRSGDCLTGSNLGLGTNSDWPDTVAVVPCTHWHIGEVFFAGNAWPQSMAYPGDEGQQPGRGALRCRISQV